MGGIIHGIRAGFAIIIIFVSEPEKKSVVKQ